MDRLSWKSMLVGMLAMALIFAGSAFAATITEPTKTEAREKLEEKEKEEKTIEVGEDVKAEHEEKIEKSRLPEDTSAVLEIKEISITGNTAVTTEELLAKIPDVYNASDVSIEKADSEMLYDLRSIKTVAASPGVLNKVTARSILGLTEYIVSVYQAKGYAGVYALAPEQALLGSAELKDSVLPIQVTEVLVSNVAVTYLTPDNELAEQGYLRESLVMEWSPVEPNELTKKKKLDDYINLLNLNPDRYISAVVSRGEKPNTIDINYNIYEANPWHFFAQVDNSGTNDQQWTPKYGIINTNLLGFDDTFTAVYQAKPDSTINDNYAAFGSYEFPVLGPELRLNLYGGYSQFEINPESGDVDFLGNGSFYGSKLRYNLFQREGWFFDIIGSIEHVRSKVNPQLLGFTVQDTDVKFWIWGAGVEMHRRDDMSATSISGRRRESLGGESSADEFETARAGAKSDFAIYDAVFNHSQFMDADKIGRLSASYKYVHSSERLVSAVMTSFGGMYSVRGYDESEIVADGGMLASLQYEYDLIAADGAKAQPQEDANRKPFVRKVAPLVFADYGRTMIKDPQEALGEDKYTNMFSVGGGLMLELGDNFSGAVYYGYPIKATDNTRRGKGRVHTGFMLRW